LALDKASLEGLLDLRWRNLQTSKYIASYNDLIIPDHVYHLFNRAVGNEKLFSEECNYPFFLQKLKKYIVTVADIYTYNLLPNHFHLFVRIKSLANIQSLYLKKKKKALPVNDNKFI
jgi:REP element-mobilizing transposase RayT